MNVDLVVYHYTEIDNVFIPANTDTHVYLVGDEEGPELQVYIEQSNNGYKGKHYE